MEEEFGEMENADVKDVVDESSELDNLLDNMTLDELHDLRDVLTAEKQDVSTDYEGVEELEDLEAVNEKTDYSYHWDGQATHNVEWDDNEENPAILEKTLRRK